MAHPHGMTMPAGPDAKTDPKALGRMLKYCRRYLPALILAVVCAAGSAVASIIGPEKISDLMDKIVDGMFKGVDIEGFEKICFTLIIIYAAGAVLGYGQQFITATVTQYTARRLRRDIDRKINRLPLRYFDLNETGDLLSRVTNDVDTISQTLSTGAANLFSSAVLFVGVMIKMFQTNAALAGVTIGTSVIGFLFTGIIMKASQKHFVRKQKDLGRMNGHIEEIYTNHRIMAVFGAKKSERAKFDEINESLYTSNWKSQSLSGMMFPIMGFVGNLAYVLIFIIGMVFIVDGSSTVTLGTIMAFVIYARLFSQPLQSFAQSMTSMQQASAASDRVFELLSSEELSDETGKSAAPEKVRGEVEFRNVRFGYLPDRTVIKSFSAHLMPGQKVAIVGPTGAGKTTVVNLLMRFYDTDEGEILIDGIPTRSMTRAAVRSLFDMILQDTWLFAGTIRENLVYNKEGVTDEDLDRVCEAAGLKHFIATLPKGYDTVLTDTLSLSEGQKQQLTIARAMIKDSPLLILDEATSSVDTRTELMIQEAMDKLTEGRTSFVIAHRLSTIKNADIILVMTDGDIIEQGDHESLLAQNGFYAELYNSQFAE